MSELEAWMNEPGQSQVSVQWKGCALESNVGPTYET